MHVHTFFSSDGKSSMDEHCKEAIKRGIDIICFTDHVDFTTRDINCGRCRDLSEFNYDVDAYFSEIYKVRDKYKNLEILSGVEFSEPYLYIDKYIEYCNLPYDYYLAAIHHCHNGVFPGAINIDEKSAIFQYYDIMEKCLLNCEFDTMAHLDFPKLFFDNWRITHSILDNILSLIIEKDVVLEINTQSVKGDNYEPMPSWDIISRYIGLGGKKVTLGSDAHYYRDIGNSFEVIRTKLPKGLVVGYVKNKCFIPLYET